MYTHLLSSCLRCASVGILIAAVVPHAGADVITDWNTKAGELIVESRLGTPPALRVMAIVQTAVQGAVSDAAGGASIDAAVAAANRGALLKLLPAQQSAIEIAYQAAISSIGDGPAKAAGIAAGERAASAVLAQRADDGTVTPESYRPHTSPGVYVPTAMPAVAQWPQRKPWLMASATQFRPAPPPALNSGAWVRDYNEVKVLGGRQSTQRTSEQTEVARFWEYSLPPIYMGVVRSVAQAAQREPARNARLYAAVAQAMDDAMISVFDAKYHYHFWRPVTAIRNGDIDNNEATLRDPSWSPLIEAPLHPEYPSAHSILAGAVGAVLKADIGDGVVPTLTTSSPSAKGATRRWARIDDFAREVGQARIYEGIHYRTSTEVGDAMGRRIGELAAERWLAPAP